MRRSAGVALLVCVALAGCGGDDTGPAPPPGPVESSWMPGQGGLTRSAAYNAIAARAEARGAERLAAHLKRIELIDARKEAKRKREREEALRKYREARARALAKYRAALEKARRDRARQEAKLAKQRAEARRRWRELLKKLHVEKGHECELPEVQREFDCLSGRMPLPKGARPPE